MNDEESIQVAIGLESEAGFLMQYYLMDDRIQMSADITANDLMTSIAVLRDLADGLEKRLASLTN